MYGRKVASCSEFSSVFVLKADRSTQVDTSCPKRSRGVVRTCDDLHAPGCAMGEVNVESQIGVLGA